MINEFDLMTAELLATEKKSNEAFAFKHQFANKSVQTGILMMSTFPPRVCGIATYTQDLIKSVQEKFSQSFCFSICAIETDQSQHNYPHEVEYVLNTDYPKAYETLAHIINERDDLHLVMIEHEFGLFKNNEKQILAFLKLLQKPIIITLHTVLPNPDFKHKVLVQELLTDVQSIIVMTQTSKKILQIDYQIPASKISIIPHGTHLMAHQEKSVLKHKYGLENRTILSTFGLLSSGKNIESTIVALSNIVKLHPDVLFLIIGKTHPSVVQAEGEKYRFTLSNKIDELQLQHHVQFINCFLPLPELLEYLQLTDIYLFSSKDPNQAVSGTFSYAISCGCAVISTPIPHAVEVVGKEGGIIVDFESPEQIEMAVIRLLEDENLRQKISSFGFHKMASTVWENAAIAHAKLFKQLDFNDTPLQYTLPEVNLNHLKRMTTEFGMLQFAILDQPDPHSGYTLDDNARALIAFCQHYALFQEEEDLDYINLYVSFIAFCLQENNYFLNYVDITKGFTSQNGTCNLSDSSGRAIWALGYLISLSDILPDELVETATGVLNHALLHAAEVYSTRSMAFIIKGLYYRQLNASGEQNNELLIELANRLLQMYRHESEPDWQWFESYLTYANSVIPEAMLCAWLVTGNPMYKMAAINSFNFLLSKMFSTKGINAITNQFWLIKDAPIQLEDDGAEQPIDIAYTIIALNKFHEVFGQDGFYRQMRIAFNWFLGNNPLQQIVYNPKTGGCYDGLGKKEVNLNQGAESTVSYLMARLTIAANNT
ncbi:MAG: hypothetical protein RLY16_2254 [Bacteroidota bacterium]|jgi:glycosyltransferase involved in cell wall biosynthesis